MLLRALLERTNPDRGRWAVPTEKGRPCGQNTGLFVLQVGQTRLRQRR